VRAKKKSGKPRGNLAFEEKYGIESMLVIFSILMNFPLSTLFFMILLSRGA
jgi:hypothetical protein